MGFYTQAIKATINAVNKTLGKNAIKSLHPNIEKIVDGTRIEAIAPNEDNDHREWRRWHNGVDYDIRDWTDEDMRSAMMQRDYPHNPELKKKVAAFFKKKYPSNVKYL